MGSIELMEWIFYSYIIVAFATYSFFAFIYLFQSGQGFLNSVFYALLTMGSSVIWPLFYIYLAICYYFKLPNIHIDTLKQLY